MLPGLEPTGKRVDVPLVAVVRFRDGKLTHEHYLLGPSLGSCAARPDRCRFPPGGRHRDRRPKSRGRIRLTRPNPMDAVQIETNMMSHPDDLKAAIACVQLCREIGNSAALRPFAKREVMPGNLKGAALETSSGTEPPHEGVSSGRSVAQKARSAAAVVSSLGRPDKGRYRFVVGSGTLTQGRSRRDGRCQGCLPADRPCACVAFAFDSRCSSQWCHTCNRRR